MKIIVQNLAIEYQDKGSGKVVLFLHGWQDTLHSFDFVTALLSPPFRVVRLDLPGFGQSETPKEAWNLDNYVQFVEAFIHKLNLDVYALVGHSFGGRITIKGQATKKLQPQKAVLISSAGIAKNRTLRNLAVNIVAKIGRLVTYIPPLFFWRNKIRKKMYGYIGGDYLSAGKLKETFLNIIAEDLSVSATQVTVSTILIWGANDTDTPLCDGKKLAALIPNSELKVISDSGHFVHKEKPDIVAKLLKDFL